MSRWTDNFPWTSSAIGFFWPAGPAGRKRWLTIAMVFLAFVVAHALLTAFVAARTARAVDRFVAKWGPLDSMRHRPAEVGNADNKARAVRAATDLSVFPAAGDVGFTKIRDGFGSDPAATVTAAERDAIRNVVADNALALSILDVAVARAGSNWELHYERGIEADVPPLLAIIQLARLNAAAGRLALEDGSLDDALAAVRRGSAIATSLDHEPILIVQLIRSSVGRINAGLVQRILRTATLSPEQLARLRTAWPSYDPRRNLQQAMIVETKVLAGALRAGIDASNYLSAKPLAGSILGWGIVRVLARPYLFREERLWIEFMSKRIDELDVPRHARGPAGSDPSLRPWDVLLRMLFRNLDNIDERCDLAESREMLLRVAFDVEQRRLDTGRTPPTLSGLVALDPLTGRDFSYETDGTHWRIRSEADLSSIESARVKDPVLDWSR